jgi:hypothetical protein
MDHNLRQLKLTNLTRTYTQIFHFNNTNTPIYILQ